MPKVDIAPHDIIKVCLVHVLNPDDWEAVVYDLASPRHQRIKWGQSDGMIGREVSLVRAVPQPPPMPLRALAARQAHFSLSLAALKKLATFFGHSLPRNPDLCEALVALIVAEVRCSEEQALTMIRHRATRPEIEEENLGELMQVEEATEVLAKEDAQLVTRQRKEVQQDMERHGALLKRVRERVKVLRGRSAQVAPVKRARAKTESRQLTEAERALARQRFLELVPEGGISQAEAKRLIPPTSYIWGGASSGSWQGHLRPHARVSYSWMAYGRREGCLMTARALWRQWCDDMDTPLSSCPTRGLFPEDALRGSASSSSSGVAAASSGGAAYGSEGGRNKLGSLVTDRFHYAPHFSYHPPVLPLSRSILVASTGLSSALLGSL